MFLNTGCPTIRSMTMARRVSNLPIFWDNLLFIFCFQYYWRNLEFSSGLNFEKKSCRNMNQYFSNWKHIKGRPPKIYKNIELYSCISMKITFWKCQGSGYFVTINYRFVLLQFDLRINSVMLFKDQRRLSSHFATVMFR